MRKTPVIHPYLLGLYPVLALAAENREDLDLSALAVPVLVTVALVAAFRMASRMASPDSDRRGLFTLLGTMLVTWYGIFVGAVRGSWILVPFARPEILLPAWIFLIAGLGWLAYRSRHSYAPLRRGLKVFASALVVFPLASLVVPKGTPARPPADRASVPAATAANSVDSARDVYFIVLDKYSGTRSLAQNYGFDNRPFERQLGERGFFVPAAPRTNYVHTAQSLASMLNWAYLDSLTKEEEPASDDRSRLYRLIEDNRALHFFKARGYTTVFLPSSYPGTSDNRVADGVLRYRDHRHRRAAGFQSAWLSGTIAGSLGAGFCALADCLVARFPYPIESAAEIEWKFRQLERLAQDERPLFVLAHLLVPHEPYVFESDCDHRDPYWPLGDQGDAQVRVKASYSAQISCVNRLLLRLVDSLRAQSRVEPIIVLQSDHGHARMAIDPLRGWNIPFEGLSTVKSRSGSGFSRRTTYRPGGTAFSTTGSPPSTFCPPS